MLTMSTVAATALAAGAVVAASHAVGLFRAAAAHARLPGRDHEVPTSKPTRHMPKAMGRSLARAGVTTDHSTLVAAWAGAVVVAVAAIPLTPSAAIVAAVVVFGPPGAVLALGGRAARIRRQGLPAVLDAVASGLRSGRSLQLALDDAVPASGPLADEVQALVRQVRGGRPLVDVVDEWAVADSETRLTGAAIATAAEVGGPGAQTLTAAAASLRERADAEAAIEALSVQARLSAILLTAAPVVFTFLLTSLDPQAAAFLLRTPIGWLCIAVGLTLDAIGAWWMHRLVKGAR